MLDEKISVTGLQTERTSTGLLQTSLLDAHLLPQDRCKRNSVFGSGFCRWSGKGQIAVARSGTGRKSVHESAHWCGFYAAQISPTRPSVDQSITV
jgi:hypothetical protein